MAKIKRKVVRKNLKINKINDDKKIVNKKVVKHKNPKKKENIEKVVNKSRHVKLKDECSLDESSMSGEDFGVLDNGFTVESEDVISKENIDDMAELSDEEKFESDNEVELSNKGSKEDELDQSESDNEVEDEDNVDDDAQSVGSDEAEDHKKALERLQETDPEFYQYLVQNDQKLLNFNLSDHESEEEDEEIDDDNKLHKPSDDLEIASDESDYEPEDGETEVDVRVVTLKMLKQWQNDILEDKSNKTIGCVVHAFHAAMLRVSTVEEDRDGGRYKVDGSAVFNGVVQLCILELGPAFCRFLGLKDNSTQPPHKCRKFPKIKNVLKMYFTDLLKLLSYVTSSNTLNNILKHLRYISSLAVSYPNVVKLLIKKLVFLWGTGEESVRAVAFLCILRLTHNQQHHLLDSVLRSMYTTYVQNSKFVSVNSLAGINFMRRSLVEMYVLDQNLSYQHAFLFIKQLAINLRNAVTVKKKENIHAVYNWKFINSLRLWGNLLSVTRNKPELQRLVYPLVHVCEGTIKLIPTAQYFPLRFHVLQVLMDLSRDTLVFVPVIPYILEVLTIYDFNKKHQKQSMKPLNFTCLLRLSKSQLIENTFKDTTIDVVYGTLLEYLSAKSHSIAFPDLVLLVKIELKTFLKTSNIASYKRKMSQLLEKIDTNIKFIENERNKLSFSLTDSKQIEDWENTIKNKGTPLTIFYESWNKLRNIKKSKELTQNEELGEYNLPSLKKTKLATNSKSNKSQERAEVELFPSDSEDDEDAINLGEGEEKKTKRGKRGSGAAKKAKLNEIEEDSKIDAVGDDIVEDLNVDEW